MGEKEFLYMENACFELALLFLRCFVPENLEEERGAVANELLWQPRPSDLFTHSLNPLQGPRVVSQAHALYMLEARRRDTEQGSLPASRCTCAVKFFTSLLNLDVFRSSVYALSYTGETGIVPTNTRSVQERLLRPVPLPATGCSIPPSLRPSPPPHPLPSIPLTHTYPLVNDIATQLA